MDRHELPLSRVGLQPTTLTSEAEFPENHREDLQNELEQNSVWLTPQEQRFLERLAIVGEDGAMAKAAEKLKDPMLFSDRGSNSSNQSTSDVDVSKAETIDSSLSENANRSNPTTTVATNPPGKGSAKRQEQLEFRRNCQYFDKVWKAHNSGLALSAASSKKSVVMRENSWAASTRYKMNVRTTNENEIYMRNMRFSRQASDLLTSVAANRRLSSSMKSLTSKRMKRSSMGFQDLFPPEFSENFDLDSIRAGSTRSEMQLLGNDTDSVRRSSLKLEEAKELWKGRFESDSFSSRRSIKSFGSFLGHSQHRIPGSDSIFRPPIDLNQWVVQARNGNNLMDGSFSSFMDDTTNASYFDDGTGSVDLNLWSGGKGAVGDEQLMQIMHADAIGSSRSSFGSKTMQQRRNSATIIMERNSSLNHGAANKMRRRNSETLKSSMKLANYHRATSESFARRKSVSFLDDRGRSGGGMAYEDTTIGTIPQGFYPPRIPLGVPFNPKCNYTRTLIPTNVSKTSCVDSTSSLPSLSEAESQKIYDRQLNHPPPGVHAPFNLGKKSSAKLISHSDSLSSLPSLNLGQPIRKEYPDFVDAISSKTKNEHYSCQRSESTSSIPSLHHGQQLELKESQGSVERDVSDGSLRPILCRSHPIREKSADSLLGFDDSAHSCGNDDDDEDNHNIFFKRNVTKSLFDATEEEESLTEVESPSSSCYHKHNNTPVMLRRASSNYYQGEGFEIADWDQEVELVNHQELQKIRSNHNSSLELGSFEDTDELLCKRSNSFDETRSARHVEARDLVSFRKIRRTLSENELVSLLMLEEDQMHTIEENERPSWDMEDEANYLDAWGALMDRHDSYITNNLPFMILGTSGADKSASPHVLSPPLMERLQYFLPFSKTSDNFWLRYSLVRDGASMHTFLQYARGAKHSILAIETLDGEVFGAYTTDAWRKTWNYYGRGESFLWRLNESRKAGNYSSVIDVAQKESEISVYKYTGENDCVQLCHSDKFVVGGGTNTTIQTPDGIVSDDQKEEKESCSFNDQDWGFGLCVQKDMLHGTTSPCSTFGSPSLSAVHSDGSMFEIINMELWALTPCSRVDDAEKLEMDMLFLEEHS